MRDWEERVGSAIFWCAGGIGPWFAEGPPGKGQVYSCADHNSALTMAATIDLYLDTGRIEPFTVSHARAYQTQRKDGPLR